MECPNAPWSGLIPGINWLYKGPSLFFLDNPTQPCVTFLEAFFDHYVNTDFWSMFAWFGAPTWANLASKIQTKSRKHWSENESKIWLIFYQCLIDLGLIFDRFSDPSWTQNESKMDLDTKTSKLLKFKSRVSKSSIFEDLRCLKSFNFWSKIIKKISHKIDQISYPFLIDFSSIWSPTCVQNQANSVNID